MQAPPLTRSGRAPGTWDQQIAGLLGSGWSLRPGAQWVLAVPDGVTLRRQGWKLHVSATATSADDVLARVAEVLATHRCPFKFAAAVAVVRELNARNADRGSSGKVVTVYPSADDDLPALAHALDEATRDLPGPVILSDRPVRPGSLVHYRYGAFVPMLRLADSGVREPVVHAPDGTAVPDRRDAWFAPPAWAPDPFGPSPTPARQGTRKVLIADRFVVRSAIRHANKGGVFRAVDQDTGAEVVVKQGRAHVDELPGGGDVRDLLHHEAAMLTRLAHTGVVPGVVAVLDLPEHTFLVTTAVDGEPLRAHVRKVRRLHSGAELGAHVDALATGLTKLLATVHDAGVVLRDFSPANVLVTPDGQLRLVDLELAAVSGADAIGAGTPGFAAPEQWANAAVPTPARPSVDLFSLGAMLFFLVVGTEPVLAKEYPARGAQSRIRPWLAGAAGDDPLVARYQARILALMADEPGQRRRTLPLPPAAHEDPEALADHMLRDGVAYLLTTMAGPDAERLWPSSAFGERTDPTTVYYGASGVLATLAQAMPHVEGLGAAVHRGAWWTADRCTEEPTVLPGLLFGRPGVVWTLLDCALALGDERLRTRALELARDIPATSPIPDLCHGTAGAGVAFLHGWRTTGEADLLDAAVRSAEHLVTTVDDGPAWWLPAQAATGQAATTRYGFAHGTAGIAAFLLGCADATGDARHLAMATRAADRLCALAVPTANGSRWCTGPGEQVPVSTQCAGGAGIASFLVRMWTVTGDPRHLACAEAAASAVRADQWALPPNSCHGVAGGIDLLLDLADATGAPEHREAAWHGVAALHARTTHRHGRTVVCDDSGLTVVPGHQTGVAGVLATLIRLRHGGPRLWLPPLRIPRRHGRHRGRPNGTPHSEEIRT